MASPQRFVDQRYLNWLSGTLSLLYVKEGIERLVDTEAGKFHTSLLHNLSGQGTALQQCFSCTSTCMIKDFRRHVWKMSCGLCNTWLQQIVHHHTDFPLPNINRDNTDPKLWLTDPFEVCKAYMPYGCQGNKSAKDGDVQGIFKLLKNCQHFTTCGRIAQIRLIDELLEFRNSLFHSGNFLVDDAALQAAQQTMLDFLRGMTSLSTLEQQSVEQAVNKITELQNGTLDLSLNRELELRALQSQQNALDSEQTRLKHEFEKFQTDSDISKTKLAEVDSDVKTIQRDVASLTTKTTTTESDLKSQAVKMAEVDSDVKTLQRDVASLTTKTSTTESDLESQAVNMKEVEQRLERLQAVQDSFNKFLQANSLDQDMRKLSTTLEHHEHRIENLTTHTQHLDVTTKQQEGEIATLYQRQQATNTELQAHSTMLASHQGRLECVEERLQNRADSGAGEITYENIPALQGRLKHYYRTMCLTVPNPVVSEEVGLDRLYVDPDIKVLRETTDPHTGLENVQDQSTTAKVSQCRQLFYSKDNKCRQIYITADAGLGKSMFCKHLVDQWCKADSEIVTNTEDRNSQSSGVIFSGHSDSGEGGCRNIASKDGAFPHGMNEAEKSSEGCDSEKIGSKICEGCFMSKVFFMCKSKRKKRNRRKDNAEKNTMNEAEKKRMEEDRRIMSEFKLLFYITLRESPHQYHVEDMIDSQILQEDKEMQHLKASVLLKKVPCLVIIDGLDEWVSPANAKIPPFVKPGIPGRDWLNTSNVFLTTTRPWKFDVLQLTSKEVDKHVELVGFNRYASVTLCSIVTELLKRKEQVQRIEGNLQAELQRKGLSHLSNIPVILTQLVCLWFDKQHLSENQVQLYCSMLEMLLKRADKNFPKQTCASKSETARKKMKLPYCFRNHNHCQTYQMLLVKLCKVAFEALFNQKREQALVFESSQMGILGVDHINVDLCLKSGILSQSKVLGKWSRSEKKLSFLHKKLQEFLAAVFITCANEETIISRVKQFCTSVESMLEMSQVWMFLSGINSDLAKLLLKDLMTSVVLKDSRLQQYRQTLTGYIAPALVRSIQTCIQECVEEATCNGNNDLCLPLEDFVINKQTISTCLERLLTFNTAAIKSVYIDTGGMKLDTVERVMCQLQDTQCLQQLYLDDPSSAITTMKPLHLDDPSSDITTMQPLCKTLDNNKDTLTCLELERITLTTELCDAVCRALTHVTALDLCAVRLTHKQREQLLLSVSQAQHIRQLRLQLDCTAHGDQCRPGIDVSGLTQLRTLYLVYMYIARLPVMTACLECVVLWWGTISESQLRQFIHALSSTSNTLEVKLVYVTVTGDSDTLADLTDLKHNPNLVVTRCDRYDGNTWWIEFHTKQQTTTASDNQN